MRSLDAIAGLAVTKRKLQAALQTNPIHSAPLIIVGERVGIKIAPVRKKSERRLPYPLRHKPCLRRSHLPHATSASRCSRSSVRFDNAARQLPSGSPEASPRPRSRSPQSARPRRSPPACPRGGPHQRLGSALHRLGDRDQSKRGLGRDQPPRRTGEHPRPKRALRLVDVTPECGLREAQHSGSGCPRQTARPRDRAGRAIAFPWDRIGCPALKYICPTNLRNFVEGAGGLILSSSSTRACESCDRSKEDSEWPGSRPHQY